MWCCGSITFGVCACVPYGELCWTAVSRDAKI